MKTKEQPATAANDDCLSRPADMAPRQRTTASEVEAIALDVEERITNVQRDSEKLRQLQALLKSLRIRVSGPWDGPEPAS